MFSILVAVPLAGCVAEIEASSAPTEASPAAFGDSTGGVEGFVTDDEGLPVEGALVALTSDEDEFTSLTDFQGRFSFSNVAPGQYRLFAQRLGYDPDARALDVYPGKVSQVQFVLTVLAVAEPHPLTQIQEGRIQCSVRAYPGAPLAVVINPGWYTGVAVCGLVSLPTFPPDKFLLNWEVADENTWELITEMEWEVTQSLGKGLSISMEHPNGINDGSPLYGSVSGESPLAIRANESKVIEVNDFQGDDCIEDRCVVTTRVFAEANTTNLDWPTDPPDVPVFGPMHQRLLDVGFALDQPFTQYLTSFHLMKRPAGFTALPDA